jgi:hypothetical protein
MTRYKQEYFACALAIVGILLVVIASGDLCGQDAPQAVAPAGSATDASRDHFVGWFSLPEPERKEGQVIPGGKALIPVFKRGGSYWTVSFGIEVPLKECPEGLEWAASPPFAEGTKFGYDNTTKTYYIIIEQQWLKDEYPSAYVSGVKQPMTKVDPPSGILDATAEPPHTNDDFVGWYQPAWFPIIRFEVRKEDDKHLWTEEILGPERDTRSARNRTTELTPLAGRLGLVLSHHKSQKTCLIYNPALKRVEITHEDVQNGAPTVIRTPLVRLPAQPPESGDVPASLRRMYIGVPLSRG